MLQSIGSVRGIAHHMSHTYWPKICAKALPACVALVADYAEGDVVVGEYTVVDNVQFFWTVYGDAVNGRTVMLELSIVGVGVSSVTELILDAQGAIDSKRSDPSATLMQNPTTINMQDNIKILDAFHKLLSLNAETYINKASSYVLNADNIIKG